MDNENYLISILKKKNKQYYEKIKHIENILNKDIFPFIQLPDYTKHGSSHSENIQLIISKLLPVKLIKKMNSFEIFALIASSLLHDIGMVKTVEENENPESIRFAHASRSKEIIEREYEKFLLDLHQAEIIGLICESHCEKNLEKINDTLYSVKDCSSPRVKFLAAILRLADILDVWSDRTSDIVFRNRIFNGISKKHWIKHQNISNVKIENFPIWDIIIYAKSDTKGDSQILRKFIGNIQNELNLSKDVLRENGLYFRQVDLVLRESHDYKKKYSNPFILLKSFTNHDTIRFAGRLHETYQVLQMIEERKIVLIIGESGVGKTSLVNAGVLPKVRRELDFEIIEFSFDIDPAEYLVNELKKIFEKRELDDKELETIQKTDTLFELTNLIKAIEVKQKKPFPQVLFVGDHLEQLFTLNKIYIEFIDQLAKIRMKKTCASFLFCIREDYLPQLFNFAEYIPEFYKKENTYRLFKLDKANAKEIFNRASEISNISLTDEFIDFIVDELYTVCEGSIYPPYLQITGHRLYESLNSYKGENITNQILFEIYSELGGVREIVTSYLTGILDKYKFEEKSYVAEILSTMTTQYYTKKRISFDELSKQFPHVLNLKKFLNSLINDRIIKMSFGDYELVHDFLAHKVIALIKEKKYLSSKVRQAISFIENNYKLKDLSIPIISNEVGVTPNHLMSIFKKEVGKKLNLYINEFRINIVKELLENTREPLKDIAHESGFRSQNTLSRTFRRIVRQTPSEYRKDKLQV